MSVLAEYEIGFERLPLASVARAVPEATLTVEIVATRDGPPPFLVRVEEGDPSAVECALESAAFVGECVDLGPRAGTPRYQVLPAREMETWFADDLDDCSELRGLASAEAVVERIEVTPTGWIQSGWFADRTALDEFRRFWRRNGAGFSIRRLTRDRGDGDRSPADGLTTRQREALAAAHEMGYFEIPRTASLDDVATELGITASSLSERLRRAQSHVVECHLEDGRARSDDPADPLERSQS